MRIATKIETHTSTTPMAMEPMASNTVLPVTAASADEREREHQADQRGDVFAEHHDQLRVARVRSQ